MKIRLALLALALAAAAPASAAALRARDLSDDELVGQTFVVAIDTEIAVAREADVRAGRVGGVLLRWDRFTGEQARAMSMTLEDWSAAAPHRVPVWVTADHEGGPTFTQRGYGTAPFPGNMALGATGSAKLAYAAARTTARELRALGVHVTFAPSLDVNSNPLNPIIGLRSFGQDPGLAARLGVAALRGYRDGGVLAVAKHFPGHGDTNEDSHLGLPVNAKPMPELEKTELIPFRAAFRDGLGAVMPAHMVFPALGTNPGQPVTLSSAAIEGFLRGRLGFKGLIFSDSLEMGAIANVYGSSSAAVLSLLAGNDVLVLGKADYPSAFAAVKAALADGRLPRARLEESVDRILYAKRRLGLFDREIPSGISAAEAARGRDLARRVAEASATIVRGGGLLPLKLAPEKTLGLVLAHSPRYADEAALFAAEISRRHARTIYVDLPLSPGTAAVAGAVARLSAADAVIVGTSQFGAPLSTGQAALLARLGAARAPVIAASLMNPYDLSAASGAKAAICLYGLTESSVRAAARVLFGEIPARGRLPVAVPGLAPSIPTKKAD
jgi:beta-N-acetylhexosaminidase